MQQVRSSARSWSSERLSQRVQMVSVGSVTVGTSHNVHGAIPDGVFISSVTAGKRKLEMSVKTFLLSSVLLASFPTLLLCISFSLYSRLILPPYPSSLGLYSINALTCVRVCICFTMIWLVWADQDFWLFGQLNSSVKYLDISLLFSSLRHAKIMWWIIVTGSCVGKWRSGMGLRLRWLFNDLGGFILTTTSKNITPTNKALHGGPGENDGKMEQ